MVGKYSNEQKMSGSRIATLYCWEHADGHPFSTPNDELRRSIAAKNGESTLTDIGEPGAVGNLLEGPLILDACDRLGLCAPNIDAESLVVRHQNYEVSMDGLITQDNPVTISATDHIKIVDLDGDERHPSQIQVSGSIPIECKCTSAYATDEPPLYRGPVQLQLQMLAVDAEFGILVTLHRSIERQVTIYRRSQTMATRIDAMCREFARRVRDEDFYPPVSVDDASQNTPDEPGLEVDLTYHDEMISELLELRVAKAGIETDIERLELEIMKAMGDATVGNAVRFSVSWPTRSYKAQPEKIVPAKEARTIRLKTLKISDKV